MRLQLLWISRRRLVSCSSHDSRTETRSATAVTSRMPATRDRIFLVKVHMHARSAPCSAWLCRPSHPENILCNPTILCLFNFNFLCSRLKGLTVALHISQHLPVLYCCWRVAALGMSPAQCPRHCQTIKSITFCKARTLVRRCKHTESGIWCADVNIWNPEYGAPKYTFGLLPSFTTFPLLSTAR
jgi:hypothetical protein